MTGARLDVDALVAALDAKRKDEDISWRELARRAGVSPSTLTRIQQGKLPDVNTLGALLEWLDMPAEEFLVTRAKGEKTAANPVVKATALLRGKKKMSPAATKALEEMVQAAFKLFKEWE